jgi:NADH:ubiquinone oxidoreductase subunit 5 (subunit L)/multisubunit Na+/H+ antiporter MnhA subunit
MSTILFLIIFPLVVALALLVLKTDAGRDVVVIGSSVVIAAASIFLCVQYFGEGIIYFDFANDTIGYVMLAIEACLALVIIVLGIKYKKYLASVLAAIQTPLIIWFELSKGHYIYVQSNIYLDKLSLIMVLIIGIIGTLICVYAIPYMKDFQHHHQGEADRRPLFFFLLNLFLSAMFGIVVSNNLLWMFFFWEITTLCSFFLIGYTKTPEAIKNSFRALIMVLIIGIIGTLICVYAIPYMKDFQHHHQGEADRRPLFFFLLFLFLSAMYGIVVSNNLLWLYFFWEITTLCSFFLIGYTKTPEAIRNSFRALIMNLLGGLGFVLAIIFLGTFYQTLELGTMLKRLIKCPQENNRQNKPKASEQVHDQRSE